MFDATPHQPVTIREANDPGLWLAGAIELLSMLPAQYYARGFAEKSRTTAAGGAQLAASRRARRAALSELSDTKEHLG